MSIQLVFDGMAGVPYNRTPTSISAAKRVKANPEHRESDKERVFRFIENRGAVGCTDYEMERALDLQGSTLRPRRGELHRESRIKAAGTRLLPNGNKATVWVKA
jgi:hypothetical protein